MLFCISELAKTSNFCARWKEKSGNTAIGAMNETVGVNGCGSTLTVKSEGRSVLVLVSYLIKSESRCEIFYRKCGRSSCVAMGYSWKFLP